MPLAFCIFTKGCIPAILWRSAGHILCATVSHRESNSPDYDFIVYDLQAKTYKTFKDEGAYTTYAIENKLPLKEELYEFRQHYYEYVQQRGWKKWLLP